MTLGLHNLQRFPHSRRPRKRVGRGLGSGHGAFSTRGVKGQRARTGGAKGLQRRSLKHLILHLPKFKGQKPHTPKACIVTTDGLERRFPVGAIVDGRAMLAARLVATDRQGIKVLAGAKPLTKAMTVRADAFSAGAKKMIAAAGGKAVIVKRKT